MANNASTALKNGLAALIFNNAALTGIGDSGGLLPSAAAGVLYVSAHTADPGVGGTQSTSEANYTGYARVAVARTSAGWTVAGANAKNAADVLLPEATGGSSNVTYFGIGTAASGAGKLLFKIPATQTYAVTTGVALKIAAGVIDITVE
ncbi:phage tail fiber protein [Stenotrophomonas nitritireducens]|uniref:phage tail fiber protein n=1 Tax=Stenotrophomonas nitritireducens TaxID=83617 RepID=UPI0007104D87|nr:hypothetical protein [Stenotrophomonas nitritireducens]